MLPGWWCKFIFSATGRFVHTTLTDQTLNTNIYGPWLLIFLIFITVVVVVFIVVVYTVLLFMWFMLLLFLLFLPCTKKEEEKYQNNLPISMYQQYKITAILDRRLLQQPSRQTLGTEKYLTQGSC